MKSLVWVIAELLVIFILLTLPGNNFSGASHLFGDLPVDKLVHVLLFGSLAFSIFFYFEQSNIAILKTTRVKAWALILCILYGIGMEFYQKYFVPSRGFEVSDMLADAIGALLALPFFTWIRKKI
jgi:VanZ family protein